MALARYAFLFFLIWWAWPHCLVTAAILLLPVVALPLVPHFFVIVLTILAVLQVVLSRTERKIGLSAILQAGDSIAFLRNSYEFTRKE